MIRSAQIVAVDDADVVARQRRGERCAHPLHDRRQIAGRLLDHSLRHPRLNARQLVVDAPYAHADSIGLCAVGRVDRLADSGHDQGHELDARREHQLADMLAGRRLREQLVQLRRT